MKQINNIADLDKLFRTTLINQTELKPEMVRNALSCFGETLEKLLADQIFVSIDNCDVILLFELQAKDSQDDVSFTDSNGSVIITKGWRYKLYCYGNSSPTLMLKLIARLRTEIVRNFLNDNGIFIEKVGEPQSINEYKGPAMWIRTDVNVDIATESSVTQVSLDYAINNLNNDGFIKTVNEIK